LFGFTRLGWRLSVFGLLRSRFPVPDQRRCSWRTVSGSAQGGSGECGRAERADTGHLTEWDPSLTQAQGELLSSVATGRFDRSGPVHGYQHRAQDAGIDWLGVPAILLHQAGQLRTVGGVLLGTKSLLVDVEQVCAAQAFDDGTFDIGLGVVRTAVAGLGERFPQELDLAGI